MTAESAAVFARAGLQVFERGWLSSNCVLFDRPGCETVLVDSGYVTHAEQTAAMVRAALGGRPLERIANTHLHSDHCGGNALLQSEYRCSVDVPAGEWTKACTWDEALLSYRASGQECPRFEPTGALRPGEDVELGGFRWEVIVAPGHDPESVVLYSPIHRLLISADALWENGFGVVFPEIAGEAGFEDVRRTLLSSRLLDVDWVIPGHGAPFNGFAPALERAEQRLQHFVSAPAKHARHAAKVLIKFHLLEVQVEPVSAMTVWAKGTPYLGMLKPSSVSFEDWLAELIEELCRAGAAERCALEIRNA